MVYPAKRTCYPGSSLTPSLLKIFALQRTCLGAHVKLLSDLPPLRFCTVIEGNLTLAITEPGATEADFHIFKDLEEIRGVLSCTSIRFSYLGASTDFLRVDQCRGIRSLKYFANVALLGDRPASTRFSFNATHTGYQLVVQGKCVCLCIDVILSD